MSLKAIATSAFGRRSVTHAQIAAQMTVDAARERAGRDGVWAQRGGASRATPDGAGAVHKWELYRTLSELRDRLGVSDRTLGVLSALLSFHPETALTLAPAPQSEEEGVAGAFAGLVVFPSNRALSLRANGMSEPTLRRHLAALVEAGLILRRDSPNGKRYARRGPDEAVSQAFGFDLAPLVARAGEFDAALADLRAERRRARILKERINLLRRDLSKRIAFALDEGLAGPWEERRRRFLALCTPLRKVRGEADFATLAADLDSLQGDVAQGLESALRKEAEKFRESSGDAAQTERQLTESNPDQITDIDPDFQRSRSDGEAISRSTKVEDPASTQTREGEPRDLPLPLVLEACPDIADYAFGAGAIDSWRALAEVAKTVRPMLGISPDAWREALEAMGERQASAAIAFLLQRCEHSSEAERLSGADGRVMIAVNGSPAIRAPGGYLRALARKASEGGAPLWSAILGHLAQRAKAKGRVGGAGGKAGRAR